MKRSAYVALIFLFFFLLGAAGLFFLGWAILLPASGSPLRQLPGWDFGLAHLAYGVALGYLVYRRSLGS